MLMLPVAPNACDIELDSGILLYRFVWKAVMAVGHTVDGISLGAVHSAEHPRTWEQILPQFHH
jgi:hypothetical protein